MTGNLKNKIRFSSTLPIGLHQVLQDYSQKSMVPISKILEAALTEYLNNQKSTKK